MSAINMIYIKMKNFQCLVLLILSLFVLSSCASKPPIRPLESLNPDQRLSFYMEQYQKVQSSGHNNEDIRTKIERLSMSAPEHVPTLMANAVIAYDAGEKVKAQQFLDQLLADQPNHTEAVILRARISMEEGNPAFAAKLLKDQVRRVPDHAILRETLGAAHYLLGNYDEARKSLVAADELGSDAGRIAYHRGLIEEAEGNVSKAKELYESALKANPPFALAKGRLSGIEVDSKIETSKP